MSACETCGREPGFRTGQCNTTTDGPLACFRLGYERERAAKERAEAEAKEMRRERNEARNHLDGMTRSRDAAREENRKMVEGFKRLKDEREKHVCIAARIVTVARWAARWKRAAKLAYQFEAERGRVAAAMAARRAALRDAALLTIGRLRGAAEPMAGAQPVGAEGLREWADQLERALAQEAGR